MKPLVIFCLVPLLFKSEGYQPSNFVTDYESSMFAPIDSRFPPSPYDSFKEELVVDQVIEESSDFKIKARNIKQWLRLSLDHLYLLGISEKEVSLVTMYKRESDTYQAHEYPLDLPYGVSCGVMFKSRQTNDDMYEGVVLLALRSPRPIVSVYKIQRFKLHHIIDWRRDHSIHAITYFKWHHEDRFIIFEERKNVSVASVYGFEFDNHAPHFWQVEMITLGATRGYPTLGLIGADSLFLATIQDHIQAVNIYSYKEVCAGVSGSKLELAFTIFNPELKAKKIEFFHAYGFLYFIVSGSSSVLFRITPDGYLMKDVIFGTCVEMMAVPVRSDRHDTILLGKSSDGTPHVYTYIGNAMWEEKLVPKCLRAQKDLVELKECIGGNRSWEGATYIELQGNHYPTLLFADRHYSGELYHLPLSYIRIPSGQPSISPHILNQLESYWDRLRTSLAKLMMARSQEGSPSTSSYCSIAKEVNKMYRALLEIKKPLDFADCSEDDHVIVDEPKPVETITLPNKSISEDSLQTPEKNRVAPIVPYRIKETINQRTKKGEMTIPISPEISNDSWDNGDILNEQHDGFEDTFNSG